MKSIKEFLKGSDRYKEYTQKERDEDIKTALEMVTAGTASPGKFVGVVGNKNRLLRLVKATIGKLKDKPIMVKEGEKVIGKLLRK